METQEYMEIYDKWKELRTDIRSHVGGLVICGEDIDMETEKIFLVVLEWIKNNTEYIKFK